MVYAGLEILRDELLLCNSGVRQAITPLERGSEAKGWLDLVQDIFLATDTAIRILNDLLSYEHIDAGSLTSSHIKTYL